MKIYDARREGGFFEIPPSPPCAASDECHGPSTQAAPAPALGTFKGTGGQFSPTPVKCKKGFVKKHGKCVKKKHKDHKHKQHKRAAAPAGRWPMTGRRLTGFLVAALALAAFAAPAQASIGDRIVRDDQLRARRPGATPT